MVWFSCSGEMGILGGRGERVAFTDGRTDGDPVEVGAGDEALAEEVVEVAADGGGGSSEVFGVPAGVLAWGLVDEAQQEVPVVLGSDGDASIGALAEDGDVGDAEACGDADVEDLAEGLLVPVHVEVFACGRDVSGVPGFLDDAGLDAEVFGDLAVVDDAEGHGAPVHVVALGEGGEAGDASTAPVPGDRGAIAGEASSFEVTGEFLVGDLAQGEIVPVDGVHNRCTGPAGVLHGGFRVPATRVLMVQAG
jgi:hypothetical protein